MSPRAFYQSVQHGEPGVANPGFVEWTARWLGPWVRLWYRPSLEGTEHLPESGSYLIVSNHSGGGTVEVYCLVLTWYERFGFSRPLAGFAHPLAFRLPVLRYCTRQLGIIPSTYEAASLAIERRVPIIVFPGGDHEGYRPIWQARRVDFAGRKGFIKIAKQHRIPIVPMAIRGSHVTLPIAWRSRLLPWILIWPRAAGVKRVPVTFAGLVVCVATFLLLQRFAGPWLAGLGAWASWTVIPTAFMAWVPSRVRLRLLPAISPESIGEDLDATYAEVTGAIQRVLEEG